MKLKSTTFLDVISQDYVPIEFQVMAYFGESSNLFYDRTCNNEVIKMQRLSPEHLQNMIGVEYVLLHVQVKMEIKTKSQYFSA